MLPQVVPADRAFKLGPGEGRGRLEKSQRRGSDGLILDRAFGRVRAPRHAGERRGGGGDGCGIDGGIPAVRKTLAGRVGPLIREAWPRRRSRRRVGGDLGAARRQGLAARGRPRRRQLLLRPASPRATAARCAATTSTRSGGRQPRARRVAHDAQRPGRAEPAARGGAASARARARRPAAGRGRRGGGGGAPGRRWRSGAARGRTCCSRPRRSSRRRPRRPRPRPRSRPGRGAAEATARVARPANALGRPTATRGAAHQEAAGEGGAACRATGGDLACSPLRRNESAAQIRVQPHGLQPRARGFKLPGNALLKRFSRRDRRLRDRGKPLSDQAKPDGWRAKGCGRMSI